MTSVVEVAGLEDRVLSESLRSPTVALMRLAIEIDRQLRLLLAASGQLGQYQTANPPEAVALLRLTTENMPSELTESVRSFWNIRNDIVHSASDNDALALRAVDYGLRILRILAGIPRPKFLVKYADVPLFRDSLGSFLRPDVKGVILQQYTANGQDVGAHLHPSTRSYFPSTSVSWEWRTGTGVKSWDATWYRGPDTMEIKKAWDESLEFVGRDLATI